jgi:UDP-N-acetylmuramate dehydrogenase
VKPSSKNWRERFRRTVDCTTRLDEPLAAHTTFGVGGPAALLAWVEDQAQLKEARRFLQAEGVPWRILGGGSNVLVADEGWPGAVLKLRGRLAEVRLLDENSRTLEVEVGAGCALARLLGWAAARGGGALGALWGIPASLGGALKYNAGTRLGSLGELVVEAALLEENGIRRYRREALHFGYRCSAVGRRRMVLGAVLRLPRWPREKIERQMIEARALRSGQPRGVRSAKAEPRCRRCMPISS